MSANPLMYLDEATDLCPPGPRRRGDVSIAVRPGGPHSGPLLAARLHADRGARG